MVNSKNKSNEHLLKESEEKYHSIYNNIRDSILVADTNRNIIDCNPAFHALFGYSKDEIVGKQTVYIYENESEFKELGEELKAHYGDKPFLKTVNYKKKSGEIFPGETNVFYLKNDKDEVSGFIGLIRDVTERKLSEEVLQKSESRLNEAQRLAKIGSWELDLITNTLYWSDEVYRLFDLEPQQFRATYEAFLDNIHPDDREIVNNAYTESVKNKTSYEIAHRLLLKDGTIKFVREYCKTLYDDAGKAVRSIGTVQDITERKQSDERIKGFSRIFGDSLNEIYLFDAETMLFTQVNMAAQKNLGYIMEEFQKMTPLDFKPEFTNESFAKLVEPLLNGEKEKIVFETVHQRKDQSLYDVEVHLQLIKHEHQSLFTAIILDITERKRTEVELAKHSEHLEQLAKERTFEVDEKNKKLSDQMKIFVGRELKIRDLEKKIRALQGK